MWDELQEAGSSMSSREKHSTVYQCMWRGCRCTFHCVDDVESHVRDQHLSYVSSPQIYRVAQLK